MLVFLSGRHEEHQLLRRLSCTNYTGQNEQLSHPTLVFPQPLLDSYCSLITGNLSD